MTIASQTSRISYNGDGITTVFSVPFFFSANSDIVVTTQVTATGVISARALGTDYTLTGATVPAGGTCTFLVAPPSGTLVTILRDPPITQTASYNNNDPFPAKSHEGALDKGTTIDQRTRDMATRSLRAADGDATFDMVLPVAAVRASQSLGFDALGKPALYNPASAVTSGTNVTFLQGGTGAVSRTHQDKARDVVSVKDFGAVADGVLSAGVVTGTDNTSAFNKAYVYAAIAGRDVFVPSGQYAIYGQVAGKSSVILRGEGHVPPYGAGSTLLNAQTSSPTALFLFPSGSFGWGFVGVRVEGNNVNAPIASVLENGVTFGSFNVKIDGCSFHQCRPAVYAEYSFDWWISNSGFIECGNTAGAGSTVAAIYAKNSNTGVGGGVNCNTWHIVDNFIETKTGLGIALVGNGPGGINQAMFISRNHFEGLYPISGHEMIKVVSGCSSCMISDNLFLGTSANTPCIDIGAGGAGNIITSNVFGGAGFYDPTPALGHAILSASTSDIISNNVFSSGVGATEAVSLTASSSGNIVSDNIVRPGTVTIALDAGTSNTIRNNVDASQVLVNRSQPVKVAGTQLYHPLSTLTGVTAYAPTLSVSSGSLTSASATGSHYRIGKVVFVWGVVTITTNGTGAGLLSVSLPSTATIAASFSSGNTATGVGGWGEVDASASTVGLRKSDGTYPGANGSTIYFSGSYVE